MSKYYCVSCGREVREEKMLVSLSNLVFDGALDIVRERNPIYISKVELLELVNSKQKTGAVLLSVEDVLRYAYSDVNKRFLTGAAVSAEKAYETYKQSYEEAKRRIEEARKKAEEKRVGIAESEDDEDVGSSYYDEDEDENEFDAEDAWEAVRIPGFNNQQVRQILENFPDGVCSCMLRYEKKYGYSYRILTSNRLENTSKHFVCSNPECFSEILDCAFECRQITIGLVGFKQVGKTCLIAALSDYLMRYKNGLLKLPKKYSRRYETGCYNEFINGYPLEKTEESAINLFNPSVLCNDVLWTFIDFPGETLMDGFDPGNIVSKPRLHGILQCSTYIFCTDLDSISNPLKRNQTKEAFERFLSFVSEHSSMDVTAKSRTFPVMLALTKLDHVETLPPMRDGAEIPYLFDWYKYKNEYRKLSQEGLESIVDSLMKTNYLTPISCSAYGFQPLEKDEALKYKEENGEFYRTPCPRNLDLIVDWIERVNALQPLMIDEQDKPFVRDISNIDRKEAHFDDNLCVSIATLFCNPSQWDKEWYRTINGGVLMSVTRASLKKKYEKEQRGKE